MVWGTNPLGIKSCDAILHRIETNDPRLVELVVLPMKNFGVDEVDRLAAAIASGTNTTLRTINASGHAIPSASCTVLGSAIATAFQRTNGRVFVREVAFGNETMGDDGVRGFCVPLVEGGGGGLETVDFSLKGITKNGTKAISRAFQHSTNLRRLLLYRNFNMGDEGIAALFHNSNGAVATVAFFPSLEYLDLSECGIGEDGIVALVDGLLLGEEGGVIASARRKGMLDLILDRNLIGGDSCRHLARMLFSTGSDGGASSGVLAPMIPSNQLPSASILRCLKLRNCGIGDGGLRALLSLTTGDDSGSHLEVLDLNGNEITGPGSLGDSTVTDAIARLSNLTELTLANNPQIGSEGIVALKSSLAGRRLCCLDLTNTGCGVDGALAFLSRTSDTVDDGCGKVVTVETLRLFDNQLGSEGFEAIAKSWTMTTEADDGDGGSGGGGGMVKNSSLLLLPPIGDLDLGGNRAGAKAVVSLLRAVLVASEEENKNKESGRGDDDDGLWLQTLEIGGNDTAGEDVDTVIGKLGDVRPDLDVVRDKTRRSEEGV